MFVGGGETDVAEQYMLPFADSAGGEGERDVAELYMLQFRHRV